MPKPTPIVRGERVEANSGPLQACGWLEHRCLNTGKHDGPWLPCSQRLGESATHRGTLSHIGKRKRKPKVSAHD